MFYYHSLSASMAGETMQDSTYQLDSPVQIDGATSKRTPQR